jgi:hypothetical protein
MDIKDTPILRAPYYKGKNFLCNPVAKNGIPRYANSRLDPKVVGTPDYIKYWEEQLYYIHNGIQTGGLYIPGRYYYYMNYSRFPTPDGLVDPSMCDLHLELAYLIDYAKSQGKNIIIAKGRRKGISEFTQKAVIDYGYRFNHAYQAGVAAGVKDYAEDFMKKWAFADSIMVPEFRVGTLRKNDDEVIAGYKLKEKGQFINAGTDSKIIVRTMHSDANMFKGLYFNDVVAEECGEFDNLKEFYAATKACLTVGSRQVGTFFAYGTGGNITKGSKDFMEMWHNPDQFNAIKFMIPATRFYAPYFGGAVENRKEVGKTPNLLVDHKPYQLIGVEDEEAAKIHILKEREIKRKGPIKDYLEELQNFPLDESEIFKRKHSNNFDVEKLNDQEFKIKSNKRKYTKYKLEWFLKEDGTRAEPLRVKAVAAKDSDPEDDCILILDGFHPVSHYQNVYCAGIDAYDQNKADSSKSKGAMCIGAKPNNFGIPSHVPLATIFSRPKHKEQFFEMCVKASVYYGLTRNTLGDKAASSGIINTYKEYGCTKYLAPRPTKFESENTQQSHEFWVSLNSYSRPMMIGLMQSAIDFHSENMWFDQHIEQVSNFDEVEVDSDNDLADAWGIMLMQIVSDGTKPRDNKQVMADNPFSLGGWEQDKNGDWIPTDEFDGQQSGHSEGGVQFR